MVPTGGPSFPRRCLRRRRWPGSPNATCHRHDLAARTGQRARRVRNTDGGQRRPIDDHCRRSSRRSRSHRGALGTDSWPSHRAAASRRGAVRRPDLVERGQPDRRGSRSGPRPHRAPSARVTGRRRTHCGHTNAKTSGIGALSRPGRALQTLRLCGASLRSEGPHSRRCRRVR